MTKTNKILLAFYLSVSLLAISSCNGCKKIDQTIDEALDEAFEELMLTGVYESTLGLKIEFEGDKVIIRDFGESLLGRNLSLVNIGDLFAKNIEQTGENTWRADIIFPKLDYTMSPVTFNSFSYMEGEISLTDNGDNKFISFSPSNSDIIFYPEENGGNNNGGNCYEGTWYSTACGDSKGVVWKFNSNKTGSFSNRDCNGICNPIVFTFSYTVSGNTMNINYDATQPIVKCNGYPDKAPNKPNNDSFTFTCDGSNLTVNSGNGSNTFTR